MGQAKARGTYEERKAKAIEKAGTAKTHMPKPVLSKRAATLLAIMSTTTKG